MKDSGGSRDQFEFTSYAPADRDTVLDVMRAFYSEDGHQFVDAIA